LQNRWFWTPKKGGAQFCRPKIFNLYFLYRLKKIWCQFQLSRENSDYWISPKCQFSQAVALKWETKLLSLNDFYEPSVNSCRNTQVFQHYVSLQICRKKILLFLKLPYKNRPLFDPLSDLSLGHCLRVSDPGPSIWKRTMNVATRYDVSIVNFWNNKNTFLTYYFLSKRSSV
jgi:hypothetical protein